MRVESPAERELEMTDDQLGEAVKKLRQVTRESMLEYALRVGSLVIHYFYGGDIKSWRHRGPKTQSFRRLARHPELPMSASSLYRCVAIFELCDRLNVVSRWSRITVSHLRAVLPLDEDDQCRLMSAANSEQWTVQRLEQEARKLTSNGLRRGRLAAPELTRLGRSIEKLHRSSSLVLESLPDVSGALGDKYSSIARNIEQSIRNLEHTREVLDELKVQVDAPRGGSDEDRRGFQGDAMQFLDEP
jgi:hypothetical protein